MPPLSNAGAAPAIQMPAWPPVGVSEGRERQADLDFPWRVEVFATQHPLLRRVEVQVLDPSDRTHVLRTLVGILPRET